MTTTIRAYEKRDKEACLNAFKSNVPLYFTEEEIEDFERFLDNLENRPADESLRKTHFFVVVHENEVVGCGGFGDKDSTNVISLAWGLIHRDFHKKGLGKELLLHRLRQIPTYFPDAPMVIDTTQHSYGFFERHGFLTEKITKDFYTVGMHRYDMSLKPNWKDEYQGTDG